MQIAVPEAMTISSGDYHITDINLNDQYDSIGIGCGMGTDPDTSQALKAFLQSYKGPLVLDADALNILSKNRWQSLIPQGSILTPHVKEFDKVFGKSEDHFQRLERAKEMAKYHNCIIIVKGAYSCISVPNGKQYFNSTGNPGMATAGSGDVLTGIISAYLAQGYTADSAVILSVYLHGLAGDLGTTDKGEDSLFASDIIANIGSAIKKIRS